MAAVGIGLALFVCVTVASFIDEVVLHTKGAGIIPGLVAGVWAAWPCFHQFRVTRYNFLHPVPRLYKVPVPQAFAKVRDQLAELTYNFGDKWHIVTADTQTKRIIANLRFTDEQTKMEGDARGQIHTHKERVQRLLELQVQMKDAPGDSTVIQFDFFPKVEGPDFSACDSVITGFCAVVEREMGPSVESGLTIDKRLPAPPWWLISITVLGLMSLWGSVGQHFSAVSQEIADAPKKLQREQLDKEQSERNMRAEMAAWKKFKESYRLP